MFLPTPERNKVSIGKYLRAQKSLRKRDLQAKAIEMPSELKQYIDDLKQKGMQFKNLQYGLFYTKNGLPYPGLIASQKILTNTIMLRVPLQCLLTTKIAFFSDIQMIFEQNPKFFSKKFTQDWQDHILLAFILYENQKGRKSEWFHLIQNLPKDIDYAIFWDRKELLYLQDRWMQLGIQQQRKYFQEECEDFTKICEKYPQLFSKQAYSLQNIKWIQSHLVTRCFGKYFEYTTMVPFAQLFNHECVDVYYSMDYKPGNPHTQNEQFYPEKELTPEQEEEIESSEGSYDAQDFYEDDEYFQVGIQEKNDQESGKTQEISDKNEGISVFLQHSNQSLDKDLRSIKSYMLTFIHFNDSVSLNYLLQVFEQLEQVAKTEVIDEQHYEKIKEKLRQIHSLNIKYVKAVKQYYSDLKSKMYVYGIKQKKKKDSKQQEEHPQEGKNYFSHPWPDDKFDDFVMLCSTKDQFEEGSQVYFCYGRLPNKLLLLRYGIALEHNKYNHLFLRINTDKQVYQVKSFQYVVQNEVNMSKYKRFKLKRTKFCAEFMTYLRSQSWEYPENVEGIFAVKDLNKELQLLEQAKQTYVKELNQYEDTLERNREKLSDKKINYHQYFCLVYKIENQEILQSQIQMVQYAKNIIQTYLKSQGKKTLKKVLQDQKNPENLMMQLMMEHYFKIFDKIKE